MKHSIFVLIILMSASCRQPAEPEQTHEDEDLSDLAIFRTCADSVKLTVSPISLDSVRVILPLGTLGPPAHTLPTPHLYWYTGDPQNPDVELENLVAPGDIFIVSVNKTVYLDRTYDVDYSINFRLCDGVGGYMSHLATLDPAIEAQLQNFVLIDSYSTGTESVEQWEVRDTISVSAGTRLGSVGFLNNLDFGMFDERVTQTVINTQRLGSFVNAVNPLDYFSPSVKASIEGKVGAFNPAGVTDHRTQEPIGGIVHWDVSGTAQGVWFIANYDETVFMEAQALALVRDNVDNEIGALSIGSVGLPVDGTLINFTTATTGKTNRKFSDVTADGTVYSYPVDQIVFNVTTGSYEDVSWNIMVQLQSETTLIVEVDTANVALGDGSWTFSSAAISFDR